MLTIPTVQEMDDETLMKHLELRHAHELKMEFKTEPDHEERRLANPEVWRTFHDTVHRITTDRSAYDHEHLEG